MAFTIVEKSLSCKIMSDDSLATSVPSPIATPIDAFLRAGASLTPSPVIATMFPKLFNVSTILIF